MKKTINILLLLLITVTSFSVNANAMGRLFRKNIKPRKTIACDIRKRDVNVVTFNAINSRDEDVDTNVDFFDTTDSRYRDVSNKECDSFSDLQKERARYPDSECSENKEEKPESEDSVLMFDGCYDDPNTTAESL